MESENPWTKSEYFAWNEGRRIIDLFELSKQLSCKRCESLLDLRRIEREERFGFASVLHVPCNCGANNELHTSRKQETSTAARPLYEVNIKASINLLMYGTGASNIIGFLAVLDIPVPPPDDSCLIVPVTSEPGTSGTTTTHMSSVSEPSATASCPPVPFNSQGQTTSARALPVNTDHSYHLSDLHYQVGDEKMELSDKEDAKPSDILGEHAVSKDEVKQEKGQSLGAAEDSDNEEFVNPMEWSSDSDVCEKPDSDCSWKADDELEEKVLKKRVGRPSSVFTRRQRKVTQEHKRDKSPRSTMRCEECSRNFSTLRGYNIHMKRVHSHELEGKEVVQDPLSSAEQENKEQTEGDNGVDLEDKEMVQDEGECEPDCEAVCGGDLDIDEEETEDEVKEKIKDVLYACSICRRAYISDIGFHAHMKKKHKITNADVKQHELPVGDTVAKCCKASKPELCYYRCLCCNRTFGTSEGVAQHLRIGVGLQVTCEAVCPEGRKLGSSCQRELFNQNALFLCHVCGKEFGKKSFYDHIRRHNPPTEVLRCEVCGFSSTAPRSFRMHLERHQDIRARPCVCNFCGKAFFNSGILKEHMKRVHVRDTQFQCSMCSKVFYLKQQLIRHLRTHQGLRPFSCEYCSQGFSTSYNLHVHQRIHTGEKPYKCGECAACFAQKNSLNVHMKKHPKQETSCQ